MAYFPNGTAAEDFRNDNCDMCAHDKDESCPVWGAHFLYAYELCNSKAPGKAILDMLIPEGKRCAMFVDARTASNRSLFHRLKTCGHSGVIFGCRSCAESVNR